MNLCLTNARYFEGNTIFLSLFVSTHYLLARKTRWLLVCDVTDDMTARHAYPRLSKVAMCVLRFGTRMSTKEIAKRRILLVFFFLRENRRSASKGFFLAWLKSGKKQFVGRSISVFLTFNMLLCTVYLCWTWLHCSCWLAFSFLLFHVFFYLQITFFYFLECYTKKFQERSNSGWVFLLLLLLLFYFFSHFLFLW